MLKTSILQVIFYGLIVLGLPWLAISSPEDSDFCKRPLIKEGRLRLIHSNQRNLWGVHHIVKFSIENFWMGLEFLEEFRVIFANALDWDFYLQRQNQIKYFQRYLPDNVLSQITQAQWSDFYYGHSGDIESTWLSHVSPAYHERYQLIRPTRLRAIAQFDLSLHGARWEVERIKARGFEQDEALSTSYQQDFRRERERYFKELEYVPGSLIRLLQGLASFIREYDSDISHLEATVHFVKIIQSPREVQVVTNSPEGIHQDGMDFVVPAFVVERENIRGGVSLTYDAREVPKNKDGIPNFQGYAPNMNITLQPGEGLLHRDRDSPLWHEVTPIQLLNSSKEGYRSSIGIDFQIK